jgi:hypothetical protein
MSLIERLRWVPILAAHLVWFEPVRDQALSKFVR